MKLTNLAESVVITASRKSDDVGATSSFADNPRKIDVVGDIVVNLSVALFIGSQGSEMDI